MVRLLLVLLLLIPTSSLAGNRDSFLLGNQAAMTGGAVTALVTDGGALYYNPAGLAANDRRRFSLNGSAIVLKVRPREAVFTSNLESADAGKSTDVDLLSAPSAGTFTLSVRPGLSLAAGSFTRRRDTYNTEVAGTGTVPSSGEQANVYADVSGFESDLVFGAGLGYQADERLRIGFAVYGLFLRLERTGRYGVTLGLDSPGGGAAGLIVEQESSITRPGFETAVGLQVAPVAGLRLGLRVRTPRIVLYEDGDARTLTTESYSDGAGDADTSIELETEPPHGAGAQIVTLVETGFAVAWEASRWSVSVEGDVTPPVRSRGRVQEKRVLWNLRVGGRLQVGDKLTLGAGAFTDRSDQPAPTRVVDQQLDWYGGTFGVQMRNPVALAGSARVDTLVLSSTFALRYAAGVGRAGQIELDVGEIGEAFIEASRSTEDVVFHEISLHIGSSLQF